MSNIPKGMKNKKLFSTLAIFFIAFSLILGITSCKKKEEVIKIGAILPLTGQLSFAGEIAKGGLDMAIENLIKEGKNIKIVYQDGQGDSKRSIDAFRFLTQVEKTKVIITYISQVGLSLKKFAEDYKIILFSNVTHPDMTKNTHYVFRMSPVVENEFEILEEFLRSKKISNIVVFYQTDEYGISFAELIKKLAEHRNYSINLVPYDPKQSNFKSIIIEALSKKNIELVVCVGFGQSLGILVKQIREYGFNNNIYASLGFILTDANKVAGDAAVGVYHPDLNINEEDREYQKLQTDFKNKFGKEMSSTSWIFYNTLLLISETFTRENMSTEEIASSIRNKKVFHGIGGIFKIQESGDIVPYLKLTQWGKK
jgi:branched-chain amino acid transport system substrate-binding protein